MRKKDQVGGKSNGLLGGGLGGVVKERARFGHVRRVGGGGGW